MARNVFNNVNLAQPVGVLQSPLFGKSYALVGGFWSSPSANHSRFADVFQFLKLEVFEKVRKRADIQIVLIYVSPF